MIQPGRELNFVSGTEWPGTEWCRVWVSAPPSGRSRLGRWIGSRAGGKRGGHNGQKEEGVHLRLPIGAAIFGSPNTAIGRADIGAIAARHDGDRRRAPAGGWLDLALALAKH